MILIFGPTFLKDQHQLWVFTKVYDMMKSILIDIMAKELYPFNLDIGWI